MTIAKRATAKDVARIAGVSHNTVSLAVQGSPRVAPSTRDRVLAVAEQLGYQPHAAAAALRSAHSGTFGFLIHREHEAESTSEVDIFRTRMWRAITDVADARDRYVLQSGFVNTQLTRALLTSGRIDGLLIDLLIPDAVIAELARVSLVPLVVVGRSVEIPNVGWVMADEFSGAVAAAKHLVESVGLDVGVITVRSIDHPIVREREGGFDVGLRSAGGSTQGVRKWFGDWTFESGLELGRAIAIDATRPRGLFVLNELMAAGCLQALVEDGLRVPEDIAIVTVEDSLLVTYVTPQLSAVHVPMYEVGRLAAHALLNAIEAEDLTSVATQLPVKLIVRGSSGELQPASNVHSDDNRDGGRGLL